MSTSINPADGIRQSRLLTPPEVSEMLNLAVGTLAVWRSSGRWNLPFVKVGRRVMYQLRDVEAWIAAQTRLSGATA